MIKRIELKNFMSHRHTVIEPAEGLTVLIGPNNVGKSAIIAALQILCYNDLSNYVVRHGEKHCMVSVETDEGHRIEWHRRTSPSYVINGEQFDRLGRSVPEELHQLLRLPRVAGNGTEQFDVHFGAQKSPIFLLDSSGATAARFFASSSDAIRLVEMQQRHREKIRDARKERTRLEQEASRVNAELTALEPVVALEKQVEQLELDYGKLGQLSMASSSLEKLRSELQTRIRQVEHLTAEAASLASLDAPPVLPDSKPLQKLIHRLRDVSTTSRAAESVSTVLAELGVPPTLGDEQHLQSLIDGLHKVTQSLTHTTAERGALALLQAVPQFEDVTALQRLRDNLRRYGREVRSSRDSAQLLSALQPLEQEETTALAACIAKLRAAQNALQEASQQSSGLLTLVPPPELQETAPLQQVIANMREQEQLIEQHAQAAVAIEGELLIVQNDLNRLAAEQTCPTCGGPLDAERLLQLVQRGAAST